LDGQIEKMQLHTLDTLLREDTWGRQVMIIQGYVPTVSIQTGNYSHAPQVQTLQFPFAFWPYFATGKHAFLLPS